MRRGFIAGHHIANLPNRRYAKMLLLMRKDAFVAETAMSEDELAKRLPWYFDWDIKAKSQEEVPAAP